MGDELMRVVVVKAEGCEGCDQFTKDIQEKPEVKQFFKDKLGVDSIEVEDLMKDDEAVNIVTSLDSFDVPLITSLKKVGEKITVCKLDEHLEPVKCAELKELPEEPLAVG